MVFTSFLEVVCVATAILLLSAKSVTSKSCRFQGIVNTNKEWIEYISKVEYPPNTYVEFSYNIRYELSRSRSHPISLIFYNQQSLNQATMLPCNSIVNLNGVQEQNIVLSQDHYWSGCKDQDGYHVECAGGRSFVSTNNSTFFTGFLSCGGAVIELDYSLRFKGNYKSCKGEEEHSSSPNPQPLPTNLLVITIYASVASVLVLAMLLFCGFRKLRTRKS